MSDVHPVVAVVQARMTSSRLPGKVLKPLCGAPLIRRVLERVLRIEGVDAAVVALAEGAAHDAVVAAVDGLGVTVVRGSESDVLARTAAAARAANAKTVMRITSDCPLIDPAVIDRVIGAYLGQSSRCDYVSNLHPPTYPDGNDVEICSFRALSTAWRVATHPSDREHTTPFFWRHPEAFRLGNVTCETGLDLSATHRIVLDYAEDYEVIRQVFDALWADNPAFGVADIVGFLDAHPEIVAINARHRTGLDTPAARDAVAVGAGR